ncbi:MAG: type III pantothenate kinase [Flavobacteriales bacterium]
MHAAPIDLVVDVGNTRLKAALFQHHRLLEQAAMPNGAAAALDALLAGRRLRAIAIGSVYRAQPGLLEHLRTLGPVTVITGDTPAPVANGYATPSTLGVDRLANAAAAWSLFPGRPSLAIDAGSCITYDLVDAGGVYRGGAIAPGLRMRARAMHAYSAHLPEIDPPEDASLIGADTLGSLASGTHHAMVLEARGYIAELRQQYPGLAVVLTGGDAPRFARALKNGIFAHPSLTLLGLHAILQHLSPPLGPAAAGPGAHRPAGPGHG